MFNRFILYMEKGFPKRLMLCKPQNARYKNWWSLLLPERNIARKSETSTEHLLVRANQSHIVDGKL